MKHILDNPIFNALSTAHSCYGEGSTNVKYYKANIAPFAGFANNSDEDFDTFYEIGPADRTFVFFTPVRMEIPGKWQVVSHIDMFQLCYMDKTFTSNREAIEFKDLEEQDVAQMEALVNLTKPGPFLSRTIELGNYTGVFDGKQLVSMAGHRFNPTPYTEISAVCTHPDYCGNGYGYGLLSEQLKRILAKAEIPFLHVRNDNETAIRLYQRLGFEIRTDMFAYVIRKTSY